MSPHPSDADPERSNSPGDAMRAAVGAARQLGLDIHTRYEGPGEFPVVVTELRDRGRVAATGAGKGVGEAALAGALFEAFERFHTVSRTSGRYRRGIKVLPSRAVAEQPLADRLIARWSAEFPESAAACAPYRGAFGEYRYPLFLVDPGYFSNPVAGDDPQPYRSMLRYASSIGTAAGTTDLDATLHGLCELIEHDGLSHALIRWFIAGDTRVDVVDPELMPIDLRRLHRVVSAALDGPVRLIDTTTELGVPTYLAVCRSGAVGAAVHGSGCSVVPSRAAERALHEVVQSGAVHDPAVADRAYRRLCRWPALLNCYTVASAELFDAGRLVALRKSPTTVAGPLDCIAWVEAAMRSHDVPVLTCPLTPEHADVAVVSVLAPRLDRFSMVLQGMPVVPTGRAWPQWDAASHAAPCA